MVDPFIDTGGIVDHHRLSKLSLHSVLLLEMPFVMDIVCSSFIPTQLIYQ
jgi:inorganic pyrophosphatase/exopolyphosphatase